MLAAFEGGSCRRRERRGGSAVMLELEKVSMSFPIDDNLFGRPTRFLKAVRETSFSVQEQETFAIVGESGSGKSTIGRLIAGVLRPTSGVIRYQGRPLSDDPVLRRRVQMVSQDPEGALDPRKTVSWSVSEGLRISGTRRRETTALVAKALSDVNLGTEVLEKYPHELSGGMRQRVAIARTLVLKPELVVLDEPTSALDVSVQAQILNLLVDLQGEHRFTYVFITHDLNIVRHLADRVLVLYLGHIMEIGVASEVVERPVHPYTKALLGSVPRVGERKALLAVQGEIPSPIDPPTGCPFITRCPEAFDACTVVPPLFEHEGRRVRCHLYGGGSTR